MFTIDANITDLKVKEKDMVKAFFSMNNHQVATPEMMLEDARSYILFLREAGGMLSSYIGLHLLLTGRNLFYAHSSNPFSEAERDSVEEEALCFVEGLGAMLDEVDFAKLSSREKDQWIDEQEIFAGKHEPESAPEEQAGAALHQEAPAVQQASQTPSSGTEAAPPAQEAPQPQQAPQTTQPQEVPSAKPAAPEMPQVQQTPPAPPVQQTAPVAPAALPAPEMPQGRNAPSDVQQTAAPQPRETAISEAAIPAPAAERKQPPYAPPAQQHPSHIASASPVDAPAARAAGDRAATPGTSKSPQDVMRNAIRAGIVKPSKPSKKKEAQAAAGVVSRDREALARLLTSF
jgi:hypothetical protein